LNEVGGSSWEEGTGPSSFQRVAYGDFPVLCYVIHIMVKKIQNPNVLCLISFVSKVSMLITVGTILLCFSAQFFSVQTKFKPEAKIFLFLRKSTGTFCFPMAHYKNKESSWNHTFFIQLESQLGS
jgi:hypothetical protein